MTLVEAPNGIYRLKDSCCVFFAVKDDGIFAYYPEEQKYGPVSLDLWGDCQVESTN